MAYLEALTNFAYSTVLTAPSPATSGVSLVLQSGDGAKFPVPPFWIVVWATGANPLTTNAEVCYVTAVSTDTLTITRVQDGSSARSIVVGDQVMLGVTAELLRRLGRWPATVAEWDTDFTTVATWATSLGSGSTASVSSQTGTGHPGILNLNSGTTAGAYATVALASATNTPAFGSGDNYAGEFIFQTPAVITDTDIRVGFAVQVTASWTWGAWIEKLAADTDFFFKVGSNNTFDARQDTALAVVASTWYVVTIRRIGSTFYYTCSAANGTRVAETAYTATNNPAGGQATYCEGQIVVNGTASSRTMVMDYMRSSLVGLAR